MKFDLDKEDSELLTPLFKWGFFACSIASFCLFVILNDKEIEQYDHWFFVVSIVTLLISLKYSKEKENNKENNNGNFDV